MSTQPSLGVRIMAQRDAWKKRAQSAEAERDRMRPVVEAARAWRAGYPDRIDPELFDGTEIALLAAVDTYETQTGGTE